MPRVLPDALGASLHPDVWPIPSVIRLMGALGGLSEAELRSTFNGGLGMVCVVPADAAKRAISSLIADGLAAWQVGEVVAIDALGARYSES